MSGPRIVAAISPHGFGHLAQCAPVLNELGRRFPQLELTVRSTAPRALLSARIRQPFQLIAEADDFGMAQRDPFLPDVEASARRYREFHADFDARAAALAAQLRAQRPDLVIADVPYLTLAAAQLARIPAVALCCLNWADIYARYCGARPEAAAILAQMRAAYAGAHTFLRTAPGMPMAWLKNRVEIGPIMAVGRDMRAELVRHGIGRSERLVLVALGGIPGRAPMERWPAVAGVRYVVERAWQVRRPDTVEIEALGLSFSDLLASSDLLITKPGYGSFTEAAAAGVPVLWVERGDWPEQPALTGWLAAVGHAAGIDRARFEAGDFISQMTRLFDRGRFAPVAPTGISQAADYIGALPGGR